MKKNIILFGTGNEGKLFYLKIRDNYNTLFFIDDNLDVIENEILGIPVISSDEIPKRCNLKDIDVIITSKPYLEKAGKIREIGISDFYVALEGFLYHSDESEKMVPVELNKIRAYKQNNDKKSILFIQKKPCERASVYAVLLNKFNYEMSLLWTVNHDEEADSLYGNIFSFYSIRGIKKFVEKSEFDIIHFFDAADILACIKSESNKLFIHDTDSISETWKNNAMEDISFEYIANCCSQGNIYLSGDILNKAVNRYNIGGKPVLVMDYRSLTFSTEKLKLIEFYDDVIRSISDL